ncbi:hypothetical protein ZIOFF_010230 [Zingiber officinale]|uniref:Uncharacterized protein n=1 Tax=Zingiber officinale TaxID=94328 RepID=A0A8J5HZC8_ZINOF|nr:hypothetical protein ZIOFF_010230 [Zingiber officinale]
MPPRAYVLIFVCWALLTVITPTLISWSASAKPNLVATDPGETLLEMKVNRRMMDSLDVLLLKNSTSKRRHRGPSPAPAPAPVTIKLKP